MIGKLCSISVALALTCAAPLVAQERFDSAEAAAQAAIDAAANHDSARLTAIFGPRATEVLTSGSATQDKAEQSEFARLARAKHRLEDFPPERKSRDPLDWRRGLAVSDSHCPHQGQMELRRL